MFIARDISAEILSMANYYPVITIVGPRQSGKTTLVKHLFKDKPYVSLENIDEQNFALSDPREFLARFPNGVILDEIQKCPELLSYIQGIVDDKNINGMYVLTGSHQLSLHNSISQSLAGRTAVLKLLPLSIAELTNANITLTLDNYLLSGGYPRIFTNEINPTKYYRDYVQTYIERDVRHITNIKDLKIFQHFIKLCAGRIGQVFNSSNLSNELGVSHSTIRNWLSVLEASFVVFHLPAYFENFNKRIIKSSKLYFSDLGLASYLLGISNIEQISRDPLRGGLVENLAILEFFKSSLNQGIAPDFYFFRESNNNEVDLIIKKSTNLYPVEIKSSSTFNQQMLKNLLYFKAITNCQNGTLIYSGEQEQKINNTEVINFKNIKNFYLSLN